MKVNATKLVIGLATALIIAPLANAAVEGHIAMVQLGAQKMQGVTFNVTQAELTTNTVLYYYDYNKHITYIGLSENIVQKYNVQGTPVNLGRAIFTSDSHPINNYKWFDKESALSVPKNMADSFNNFWQNAGYAWSPSDVNKVNTEERVSSTIK